MVIHLSLQTGSIPHICNCTLDFRLQNFLSDLGLNYYFWHSLTDPVDELRKKYNINITGTKLDFISIN